ncbi:uncharacterized protein LOC126774862 [Nymphalis io]|uniref:uncharacterized protein LOC126774862 n=1 Tax=Inachis io TaxID=171585 RepID=UPI00216A8F82|nr:uncharacterized protein LOC126774862 [Nymphalis io]
MLKYSIKNGYIENDIPIYLDPFEFDNKEFQISLPNKILSLNAGFRNGVLTGLGNFDVQNTEFIKEEISVELSIIFPLITFQADYYKMKGAIYEIIPIAGKGIFEFQIHNLTLSGKVYLKQSHNEKSILINKILNSQFNIQQIVSHVDFDNNIDDIANAIIADHLASNINRLNQFLIKTYGEIFISFFNNFLNNFDSWQILATLL